jgi:hypothetical protein
MTGGHRRKELHMQTSYEVYEQMKGFLAFDDADAARLKSLGPVFEKHGPGITQAFYDSLEGMPATAKIIEGRVDALKKTHVRWLGTMFAGQYGRPFFEQQFRIGQVHVTNNILPEFVEGVTTTLRLGGRQAIRAELGATDEAHAANDSLVKVLDLCLLTINLAYQEERLDRISTVTGMSRRLLENLVKTGGKKKKKKA